MLLLTPEFFITCKSQICLMYATGSCTPLRNESDCATTRERRVIAKNLATKTQPTRTHSNWEPNPFVRPSICLFVCLINRSIVCLFCCYFLQTKIHRPGGWGGWVGQGAYLHLQVSSSSSFSLYTVKPFSFK